MSSDEEEGAGRMNQRIDIRHFAFLFRGRLDAFGLMQKGKILAVRRPVSLFHYRLHLEGKVRIGIYPLLSDGRTFFLALDFDGPGSRESAWRVLHFARHFHLPFVWEVSKSGDAHLWLFFSGPVSSRDARRVARMLLEESEARAEIFPKQDEVPEGGMGNFIWLPLSGESVGKGRTLFIDPESLEPYPDQNSFLSGVRKVSEEDLARLVDMNGLNATDHRADRECGQARTYPGHLLPCAQKMLEGVSEGCRDVVAFRLAIHLKANGYPFQKTEQLLQEWNTERNRPPLTHREITVKIRSAYLHDYTGYGCEDPLIIPFCDEACPVKQKALAIQFAAEEGCQ